MAEKRKLRWLRLDNAAKIYPAARRKSWSNIYRMSVTLTEPVDREVLQSALDATVPRFPSIAARLRKGMFWYYLEQLEQAPRVRNENSYPMVHMSRGEMRRCAIRVIAYGNRIAIELFHALTDGTGAMIFLKSLTAEYLTQKYGIKIPAEKGVYDRTEQPREPELEDSFLKYGGTLSASRKSNDAWHVSGNRNPEGFLSVTCLELPTEKVVEKARAYGVTVTAFLTSVLLMALQELQLESLPRQKKRKSIKVLIPVNLRRLFPSQTLRNFAMYSAPELQPRLGYYEFEEICRLVSHKMGLDITPKNMSAMIASNIAAERIMAVRLVPLFLKNMIMRAIFDAVGERKSSLTMSNMGKQELPPEMERYVNRMDFILGIQAAVPNNCGVVSYRDTTYVNFIRNIREPKLEQKFYQVLRSLDIPVTVSSNRGESV